MTRSDALYVGLQDAARLHGDPRWPSALERLEERQRPTVAKALSAWLGVRGALGLPHDLALPGRLYLLPDGTAGIGFPASHLTALWEGVVDEAWRAPNELGVLKHLYEDDPAYPKDKAITMMAPAALAWWLYKCQPVDVSVRIVFVRHGFEKGVRHLEHRIGSDLEAWSAGVLAKLRKDRGL